jgi:general secretion pathway protein N
VTLAAAPPAIVDLSGDEAEPKPAARPMVAPQPARSVEVPIKAAPSANPLWGVPLSKLAGTRDRPIFSPTRRPPAAVAVKPPPPPQAVAKPREPERPQLSLVGTIVNGNDGYGIFMDEAKRVPVRVRIGGSYEGWTLRSLQANAATLGKGFEHAVLKFPKSEPKTGMPRIAPAGPVPQLAQPTSSQNQVVTPPTPNPPAAQPQATGSAWQNPFLNASKSNAAGLPNANGPPPSANRK